VKRKAGTVIRSLIAKGRRAVRTLNKDGETEGRTQALGTISSSPGGREEAGSKIGKKGTGVEPRLEEERGHLGLAKNFEREKEAKK